MEIIEITRIHFATSFQVRGRQYGAAKRQINQYQIYILETNNVSGRYDGLAGH